MSKFSTKKVLKGVSLSFLLGIVSVLPLTTNEVDAKPKTGIVLHNKKKLLSKKKATSIYVGEKKPDLDLILNGKNIAKGVKWSSSKNKIVTVNKNGKLTAKKNGSAFVIAQYKGKKYKVRIKVYTRADSIKFMENLDEVSEITLPLGETKKFNLDYGYSNKVKKAVKSPNTTYNSYVFAEGDVVRATKENGKSRTFNLEALNEGETYVKVYANHTNIDKVRSKKGTITATLKVVVKSRFFAKQIGTKKIIVRGKGLTSNIKDYIVKSDRIEKPILSVTPNETGTEAVIEMSTVFGNDNCTVEFSGKLASFVTEKEVIDKIDVPSRHLVLNGDSNANGGTIEYKITNQFNEDITKEVRGISAIINVGKLKITEGSNRIDVMNIPNALPLGSKISLTISKDGSDSILENFELELSKKSVASSTVFRGIYDIRTGRPYTLRVGEISDNADARIMLEVKDQYGRNMKSTEGVNISSDNGKTGLSVLSTEYTTLFTINGVDCVVVPFLNTALLNEGVDEFKFVAYNGDNTNNKNITIAKIPVVGGITIDKLSVTPPSIIYANKPAYFTYKALTKDGKSITNYRDLTYKYSGLVLPLAFSWEKAEVGEARLKYDPSKDINIKNVNWNALKSKKVNIMFMLGRGSKSPGLLEFEVKATPVPDQLKKFTVNGISSGGKTENILPNISIIDNYGNLMSDLSNTGEYYLGFKRNSLDQFLKIEATGFSGKSDGVQYIKLSDLNKGSLRFKADDTKFKYAKTESFLFALYKGQKEETILKKSEINIGVTVAETDDVSNINIILPDVIYSEGNKVKVVVRGTAPGGDMVTLKESEITIYDSLGIADDKTKTLDPSLVKDKSKSGDIKDVVSIVINDGLGTKITKEVIISSKTPRVTKVKMRREFIDLSDFNKNASKAILDSLDLEDNYTSEENEITSTSSTKDTLKSIKFISSSNANVTIDWDNTLLFKAAGLKKGDTIKVQVIFESGVTGSFNFKLE